MNAKENAQRLIRFDAAERIDTAPPLYECSYFGINHEPFAGPGGHDSPIDTQWRDIWGVGWHKKLDGVMAFAVEHPVDLAHLERFRFPDPDDERICERIFLRADAVDRDNFFLAGGHRETLWERCYNLAGMDRLMIGFVDCPDAVHELLGRVMDFQLGIARHYIEVGIEWANLGDDLGSQRAALFSPATMEEFFVPQYRRLIELYKRHGVVISLHSCGHIEPLLETFIGLGVDVLNPIQASANDLSRVRQITQGRLALQGGVSTATVMAGPVQAIVEETRLRMWQLGRDGGYFCAPDQGMPFPEPHIAALRETVEQFGQFPIQRP